MPKPSAVELSRAPREKAPSLRCEVRRALKVLAPVRLWDARESDRSFVRSGELGLVSQVLT